MTALDELTVPRRELAREHRSGKLECVACAHRCKLGPGKRGACRLRFREGQELRVPWGYTAGVAADPIEKKPFFHFLPGSVALSFGMLGCDMRCDFCQNWFTSQTLRDARSSVQTRRTSAEALVELARHSGCRSVVSTYNEPLITAEWAHEIFTLARREGLATAFVSNGHATPEALDYLCPALDAYKVDLKAFREQSYRRLGGRLEAVKETIASLVERGLWVEVVTLVVPGLNDDPAELAEIAAFLAATSPSIPWHVSAFHPDYRMTDRGGTARETLARARAIGLEAGLEFVYSGNAPGAIAGGEDTCCPGCGTVVVKRVGFSVLTNRLADGRCPACSRTIPGRW